MIPYDEQQVVAFEGEVVDTYVQAGRTPDLTNVVWAARMVYDAVTMGYPASRTKHLRELRIELGLPVPVDPSRWRGAFCIPDVLPGIPYGDGKRIWTPAFGCYAGTEWQDRIIRTTITRNYGWFEYQASGKPYREDYPELAVDVARIVADLTKLKSAGLATIMAFDDRQTNLDYLRPIADATQDLVDCVMGLYELNGVCDWDENEVISVLTQQHRLYPNAINAFHSTTQDNGSRGFGEKDFWIRAVTEANVSVYFLQQSAWNHDFASTVDRAHDFCSRLIPGANGWPKLAHGVVLFEETTSVTYRTEPESYGVQMMDRLMGAITPRPHGYMDGGSVTP